MAVGPVEGGRGGGGVVVGGGGGEVEEEGGEGAEEGTVAPRDQKQQLLTPDDSSLPLLPHHDSNPVCHTTHNTSIYPAEKFTRNINILALCSYYITSGKIISMK